MKVTEERELVQKLKNIFTEDFVLSLTKKNGIQIPITIINKSYSIDYYMDTMSQKINYVIDCEINHNEKNTDLYYCIIFKNEEYFFELDKLIKTCETYNGKTILFELNKKYGLYQYDITELTINIKQKFNK